MSATPDASLARAKRPNEEFVVSWNFVKDLATGDSLKAVGGAGFSSVTAKDEADADVTGTFLHGAVMSGTSLNVQVQGGTVGKTYFVLFHAETTNGDVFERVLRIPMVGSV